MIICVCFVSVCFYCCFVGLLFVLLFVRAFPVVGVLFVRDLFRLCVLLCAFVLKQKNNSQPTKQNKHPTHTRNNKDTTKITNHTQKTTKTNNTVFAHLVGLFICVRVFFVLSAVC